MGKLYDYEDQEKKDFVLKMNTDEIPDYNAKKARKNKRRSKVSALTTSIFAIAIVGVSIVLSIIIINSGIEVLAIKKENRSIVVDIPENSDVPKISKILEERGVISSANLFNFYYKLVGNNIGLNFGSYELNRNMSYDTIIDNLARYSAAKDEITVTFPEGFTIYEIALRLEENNVCSADEFIKVVNEKDFGYDFEKSISNNSLKFHKTEGFLFPDTYNFYEKDNAYNVAKKLFKNFNNKITDELKQQMKDMNYTLEQTIIIASIIEKEAPNVDNMRLVSSVYKNRLDNKDVYPNLQACPTRDYANELKKQMDIINQDIINAYNTYEDAGLPPGAICNPGIDAIEAALDPVETDYFYFCTNTKTGEFYYAKTLAEHEKNIRKAGLV